MQKKVFFLLKPHGSLNWNIDCNGRVSLEQNPYAIKTAKGRIIPPTWFKYPNEQPYKSVWENIRREIRGCSALVVIGYSMPPTDLFSRGLFKTDLESIKFLVAANPDHSDRRRFIDLIKDKIEESAPIVEFDNLKGLASSLKSPTDGTVSWGNIPIPFPGSPLGKRHLYGKDRFRFHEGIQINFHFPVAIGGYFYFTLPAGTEPAKLLNEVGHEQIHKWKKIGSREWRWHYDQHLLARSPQHYTLTVRPVD